jgi:hypothetical protein
MLLSAVRTCSSRIAARYASNFGQRNGGAIANKASILSDVDEALTGCRPPDLEVLLADHLTATDSPAAEWAHALFLRFGHVSVRYTTSDGRQRVMNIFGGVEGDMVNFVEPSDYLYGTHGWETYAQQGGAYQRDFVGVRVERCAPGTIDSLHAYYEALKKRSHIEHGGARFQLVNARLSTLAAQLPPPLGRVVAGAAGQIKEATEFLVRGKRAVPGAKASRVVVDEFRHARRTAGNCAQWTSSGIEFAGLIPRTRLFPKSILIDLLESETRHGREKNVHVVLYEKVKAAPPYLEGFRFRRPAFVHPLSPARNLIYSNMREFADAIVSVDDTENAVVDKNEHPRRPPRWFSVWRAASVGGSTLILVSVVDHIGPMGPAAAAVWLGMCWWLY